MYTCFPDNKLKTRNRCALLIQMYIHTYLYWRCAHQSDGVSHSPPQSSSPQRSTPCGPLPQQHGWLSVALLQGALTSATFHAPWVLRSSLSWLLWSHQSNAITSWSQRSNTLLISRVGSGIWGEHKKEKLTKRCSALLLLSAVQVGGFCKKWSTPIASKVK